MLRLENVKAIIASRTIWAIIAMVVIGLLGINLHELPPDTITSKETARLLLSLALVGAAFAAIWFRVKADNKLHQTPYDSALITLMALPVGLCFLLGATGCTRITAEHSALDTAKIAISTMNELYLPAREAYEKFYNAASDELKASLNKTVNPVVNKANASLVKLTSRIITWADNDKVPDDYEAAKQEAEKDLADAIQAMSRAQDSPE